MKQTLSDYSITELKAIAYDQLATIERAQANLRAVTQEIEKRANLSPVVEEKTEN